MSDFMTHDGTVRTDELFSPGYVSFRCDAWGLPDNTMGQVGWYVSYRPLWTDSYSERDLITEAMRVAVREHYAAQEEAQAEPAESAPVTAAEPAEPADPRIAALVKRYGTAEAAWEAEDEMAWAALNNAGY